MPINIVHVCTKLVVQYKNKLIKTNVQLYTGSKYISKY